MTNPTARISELFEALTAAATVIASFGVVASLVAHLAGFA
jgi:hypothetical protein